ncbi:uncharacterized protein [Maniola hyperantus]|uniref:uncharacterized protein n=1 Tax=Aphantopus hyperantus TaxID=2795564 RepID=UPI003749D250
MSEDTTSSPYTEEEYADMIQCYLISGKKLALTQTCYANRYPDRTKPELHTLEKVVQEYQESLVSTKTTKPEVKITACSYKDDRIVRYFITNSHATVKKAASIFSVQTNYVEKLLEKRKAEIEAKRNENKESRKQEQRSLNHILRREKKKVAAKVEQQESSESEKETVINKDELDSEESDVEILIEKESNSGVICSEAIKTETQDVALCSEASNSYIVDTSDNNLLCEINWNEAQDVGNWSETSRSETDDDVIYSEVEYTKKRKKKYSKRSGTKKSRTSGKRKQKSSSYGPKTLGSSHVPKAIVYTTRLEEMAILHKKIKHLDNALVMNEILWESKPKYIYRTHTSNINVRRTMSFKLLKMVLKKLKQKEKTIDLTDKVGDDNDDLIINDIITLSAEDTVASCISNKCNVVIVINNLFSNLCDIYVTDLKGNLIEYCCTKINDKYTINKFDRTKVRLILNICCWVRRQHKIESIWPRNECNFFRFLITTHKCPTDQCTCCCKPKQRTTEVTLYKPTDTHVTKSDEYNECLILTALNYKKPEKDTSKNTYTRSHQKISPRVTYLFTETSQKGICQHVKNECVEIGSQHEIIRFHVDNWRDYRQRCNQCMNMTFNKAYHKLFVCCKWKRDFFLYGQFKTCNISANTLRFLNGSVPLENNMCNGCKNTNDCKITAKIDPKTNQSSNLAVDIPEIEHTRTSVKPTLLKICYKNNTPYINTNINSVSTQQTPYTNININSVTKLAHQIPHETKSASMTPATEIAKTPSTVKLKVTCNQIPELDFLIDSVGYQTASEIVTKLTYMRFTVKEDLKIVASLNTPMQTTSTEEFQILARMLLTTQNYLKCKCEISPGSDINLVAKIVTPSGLETNSNRQGYFNIIKNLNNDTVAVGEGGNDIIVKPTELAILKVLEAFKNSNYNKPIPKDFINLQISNPNFITNKNLACGYSGIIDILDNSCSNQSTINRLNQEQKNIQTFSEKNRTIFNKEVKTKGWDKNLHKNKIQVRNVASVKLSSDNFGRDISDINYDEAYNYISSSSTLTPYDGFANVIRCNKKCYTQSFKSYLKDETQTVNVVMPKISKVFSLQNSAQQPQKETKEPFPSTSKVESSNNLDIASSIPLNSYNDNINIRNHLNACPSFSAEQLMLYDPTTRMAQMVRLNPKGLFTPADYVNTITPPITQNVFTTKPIITIPDNNLNIGVPTPTNQICDGKMTFMPVALQPVQEHCILPDIINDIPKNIDANSGENDEIVVKEEADDELVLVSD